MRFNLPLSVYQRLPRKVRVGWLYGVDLRVGKLGLHMGFRPRDPVPSMLEWFVDGLRDRAVTFPALLRHPVNAMRYMTGRICELEWLARRLDKRWSTK